jgi:hypothetical protein
MVVQSYVKLMGTVHGNISHSFNLKSILKILEICVRMQQMH